MKRLRLWDQGGAQVILASNPSATFVGWGGMGYTGVQMFPLFYQDTYQPYVGGNIVSAGYNTATQFAGIAQGLNYNQRVGNSIRLMGLDVNLRFDQQAGGVAGTVLNGMGPVELKIVVFRRVDGNFEGFNWFPADVQQTDDYQSSGTISMLRMSEAPFDHSEVQVLYHKNFFWGPRTCAGGTTTGVQGAETTDPYTYCAPKRVRFKLRFGKRGRKITFPYPDISTGQNGQNQSLVNFPDNMEYYNWQCCIWALNPVNDYWQDTDVPIYITRRMAWWWVDDE